MRWLKFVGRISRRLVWETAMDNTTGLAAQMAYQFLFTLAPGLLFLWHLLSLFGTDPAKLHQMFDILKSFLPQDPKVQDIIDTLVANVVVTGSSGWVANVGIVFGIWLGHLVSSRPFPARSAARMAFAEDRNWWAKYVIAFFLLFWFGITILFCFNAMVFGETLAGIAEVNFQLTIPLQEWVRVSQYAADRPRARRPRARALSAPAGKLSDRPAGFAGRDFLRRSAGSS